MPASNFIEILNALPQTQCGECGFPGCKPYAEAIANHQAPINLCPPGGLSTLEALGRITQQDPTPLLDALKAKLGQTHVVKINEAECIGCTKCLPVCPVDAIYGAAKQMHVVIADQCTGCNLCIAPCPMDCIDIVPVATLHYDKAEALKRYETKLLRGNFKRTGTAIPEKPIEKQNTLADKKTFIAEAIARARAKKQK